MLNIGKLHPKYITDETGEKQSVILPISDFKELIDDIEDLAAIAERRDEPTISHAELIKELHEDGIL
ncbi:MAG: hypothetical protein LGR52_07220 [Candidatus Thiosymbion ectosymbiont of Robbea hypermnestra]|nr:hypothetical protein [Candidatus Thiosymbion ectosymbiont of Robbea hypermnestra]